MVYVVWLYLYGAYVDRPFHFGPFKTEQEARDFLESQGLVLIKSNPKLVCAIHGWCFDVKDRRSSTGRYWHIDRCRIDDYSVAPPSQIPPSWFKTPSTLEGVTWRTYEDD